MMFNCVGSLNCIDFSQWLHSFGNCKYCLSSGGVLILGEILRLLEI